MATVSNKYVKDVQKKGSLTEPSENKFAWYDEKVGRWRAGSYTDQARGGVFISEEKAMRIRETDFAYHKGVFSHAVQYTQREGLLITKDNVKEIIEEGITLLNERMNLIERYKRQGYPNPRQMAEEEMRSRFELRS